MEKHSVWKMQLGKEAWGENDGLLLQDSSKMMQGEILYVHARSM